MCALNLFDRTLLFYRLFNFCLWGSAAGLLLLAYALMIEPSRLVLREVEFQSPRYSGPALRIALITDIHINGLHVPPQRVRSIVETTNTLDIDLVLMPGNFVSGHDKAQDRSKDFNEGLASGLKFLSNLNAPAFATIGNHDAWYDAEIIAALLRSSGVTVLENDAKVFAGLCLVGLADATTAIPSRLAYEGCPETHQPFVFTHSPDAWKAFRSDTVLAVAGHTHGGQVNFPIIGRRVNATSLGPEHSYGFSQLGSVDVFVSAGIGTSILPIRFRAPPEIVVITLSARKS